jgi:AcrR family transcriptional regulator
MAQSPSDRAKTILLAALATFSRYGFARTTMDDIAQGSGVPRTALYRIFRSKEEIFRALAQAVHDEALDRAKTELSAPGPFNQRLENALIARDVHLLSIGHTGPHADEIADLYLALAKDLSAQSNQTFTDVLAAAMSKAMDEEGFPLKRSFNTAEDCVHLLRLALEGVKKEIKSPEAFETLARQLIRALLT